MSSAAPLTTADPVPRCCTVLDICRLLQISKRRFYQLRAAQRFPFKEIEPRIAGPRFSGADVQLYLEGHFAPRGARK